MNTSDFQARVTELESQFSDGLISKETLLNKLRKLKELYSGNTKKVSQPV